MRWGALGAAALALALGALALGGGGRPVDAPLPRPADAPPPERVAVLGTSLSHDELWPAALEAALTACRAARGLGPAEVVVAARPGAGADWGAARAAEVARAAPDAVLIEFSANDSDRVDGIGAAASLAAHGAILDALGGVPAGVMAMAPAHGPRGWARVGRRRLEARLAALAAARGAGALDLVPFWEARWAAADESESRRRRDLPDGLHPRPEVAAGTIPGPILDWIAPDCRP